MPRTVFHLSAGLCLVLFLGILAPESHAGDRNAPVVAVFEIGNRGSPLSKNDLVSLTDYLLTKLGASGYYQIIPREDIRKRVIDQKRESYKSCYDQSCQIEVGRELAAQYIVSSNISRLGNQCILTTAMYDLRKAATIKTAAAKGLCTTDALLVAVETVTGNLENIGSAEPNIAAAKPVEPAPQTASEPEVTNAPAVEPTPPPVIQAVEPSQPAPQTTAAPSEAQTQPPPSVVVESPRPKSTAIAAGASKKKSAPPRAVKVAMPPTSRKSLLNTFLWSLLPAGGMFYLDHWVWGSCYLSLAAGGVVLLGIGAKTGGQEVMIPGAVLLVGGWLGSMIHAVVLGVNLENAAPVSFVPAGQDSSGPVQVGQPGRELVPTLLVPVWSGRF